MPNPVMRMTAVAGELACTLRKIESPFPFFRLTSDITTSKTCDWKSERALASVAAVVTW